MFQPNLSDKAMCGSGRAPWYDALWIAIWQKRDIDRIHYLVYFFIITCMFFGAALWPFLFFNSVRWESTFPFPFSFFLCFHTFQTKIVRKIEIDISFHRCWWKFLTTISNGRKLPYNATSFFWHKPPSAINLSLYIFISLNLQACLKAH